jgi:formylglycine-generating enzyme required for sulfatase activity
MAEKSWVPCAVLIWLAPGAFAAEGTAQVSAAPAPRLEEPATGMEMLFAKGGCYQMGNIYGDSKDADDERVAEVPVHEVCVDDFYIGKFEVTQGQWKSLMGNRSSRSGCDGRHLCRADDCPIGNAA